MTETKTVVQTKEVEMVECSSCGQVIEKDKAYKFVIHTETNNKRFDDNHPNQYRDGWACGHCVENPISFPVIYRTIAENTDFADIALTICAITLTIIFGITIIVHILLIT